MAGENKSPFGEKLTYAVCRMAMPPQTDVETVAEIWAEGLQLKPKQGRSIFVPYTEISKIEPINYRIHVSTSSREMTLSALGIGYDAFVQRLTDASADALARALLMQEPTKVYEARATYASTFRDKRSSGACRARIYPTGIVVLPPDKLPFKVPFSSVLSVGIENYRVRIVTSDGVTIELSRMGNTAQFLADKISETQRNLESETLETIRGMLPTASYEESQALNELMSEGRAAMRKHVEAISGNLWKMLEAIVNESPLAETYRHVSSIGIHDHTAIGLKKTLQGIYVWFLVPILGSLQKGGNSLAMEVTSETGHATYLFRIMSRGEFPSATPQIFLGQSEESIRAINEAMISTGFRREPIYLSDDKLSTPAYSRYLYAASNLDVLKLLRERFYARLIHTTYESWQKDLEEALAFNTSTTQDVARWGKSKLDEPEE